MIQTDGNIFVVALVLAIIFAGLGLFLFYLDNKLKRLENKITILQNDEKDRRRDQINVSDELSGK